MGIASERGSNAINSICTNVNNQLENFNQTINNFVETKKRLSVGTFTIVNIVLSSGETRSGDTSSGDTSSDATSTMSLASCYQNEDSHLSNEQNKLNGKKNNLFE